MKSNIIPKIWFFSAICFLIVGIGDKNTLCIILGCLYICIGCSKLNKKTKTKEDKEK